MSRKQLSQITQKLLAKDHLTSTMSALPGYQKKQEPKHEKVALRGLQRSPYARTRHMSDLTSSVLTGANRSKSRSISPLQQTPYRHASPLTQTSQKRTPAKTSYTTAGFNQSLKPVTRTYTNTSPLTAAGNNRQRTPVR